MDKDKVNTPGLKHVLDNSAAPPSARGRVTMTITKELGEWLDEKARPLGLPIYTVIKSLLYNQMYLEKEEREKLGNEDNTIL